jgi:hypothetical protein
MGADKAAGESRSWRGGMACSATPHRACFTRDTKRFLMKARSEPNCLQDGKEIKNLRRWLEHGGAQ